MHLLSSPAPWPRLLLGALGLTAACSALADISGVMTDVHTQAPLSLDRYPNVILYQCMEQGDRFCTGFTGFAEAAADGSFSVPTAGIPAGRYQLLAGASDYSYTYSATFTLAPGGVLQKDLRLAPLPVAFDDIQPCAQRTADGWCRFEYTLTNRTARPLQTEVWAQIYSHTNMPAPDAGYVSGNASFDPMLVDLAAGQARRVSQSVFLGVRDAGSNSLTSLYAAPKGQPNQTNGFHDVGLLTDRGGAITAQRAPAAALRAAQQASKVGRASNGALAAAQAPLAIGPFIVGKVIAEDTRQPAPVSLSPRTRLITCAQPTDAYCSAETGEFVYLGDTGEYQLNTSAVVPGRYQIEAQARGGYGYVRSAAFDAPAAAGAIVNLVLPTPTFSVTNASGCETIDPADGGCTLAFDVTNTTKRTQSMWLWTQVNAYLSGSDVGVAVFVAGGSTSMTPSTVSLAAGATKRIEQRVTLGQRLKAGAEGELRVYVGRRNDPSYADSYMSLGYYRLSADGSVQRRAAD
jgi:hypothetical protein